MMGREWELKPARLSRHESWARKGEKHGVSLGKRADGRTGGADMRLGAHSRQLASATLLSRRPVP